MEEMDNTKINQLIQKYLVEEIVQNRQLVENILDKNEKEDKKQENKQEYIKNVLFCDLYNISKINILIKYMQYILEKNKVINLTSIKDIEEFIKKHIVDSAIVDPFVKKYILEKREKNEGKKEESNLKKEDKIKYIDIGTGGGFPLQVINILNFESLESYALDSVAKKLNVVCDFENVDNKIKIIPINQRAEIAAHGVYRENMDIVTSRALSSLENAIELMSGFIKIGGIGIALRGKKEKEKAEIEKILKKFSLKLINYFEYKLFSFDRSIIIFKKLKKMDNKYPNKNSNAYSKKENEHKK